MAGDAKTYLSDIADDIRAAIEWLGRASGASYDTKAVEMIRAEQKSLDTFLTQLKEAQSASDPDLPGKALAAVKEQASSLRAASDRIKSAASEVCATGEAEGYMEQSVTFIAQALATVKSLP